jgi:hypothetical protein
MDIGKVVENLRGKGYTVHIFDCGTEAATYLQGEIIGRTVGFGDSGTISALKLFQLLSVRNTVFDPAQASTDAMFTQIAISSLKADVFLTSVNALAETGELVNIDDVGNRIAGSLFGHEKVYFVVGVNKLAPTLDAAIWRARNVAAPRNAKRLGLKTPCASKGDRCYDCASPQRICNGMTIHFRKMTGTDMEVLLIQENLGL